MFSLSKGMTFLFLPPGIFILLALLSTLLSTLALRRLTRHTPGRRLIQSSIVVLAVSALSLYALSIEPVSELLLRPLEQAHPPLMLTSDAAPSSAFPSADSISVADAAAADAIVVLGAGTVSRSPEEGEGPAPGVETLKRLSFAYRIHRISGLPLITSGGPPLAAPKASPKGQPPAATIPPVTTAGAAMKGYLIALGADPRAVKTEETSRNTYENAAHIAETYNPAKVILVTSAYHMPRSVWVFQQVGLQVHPAPTDYKADADGYNLWSFFPRMDSLDNSYKALHEYMGILYYLLIYEKKG
jgi:uncharacterized SAM-binding protein YcdF (DUF218 family)